MLLTWVADQEKEKRKRDSVEEGSREKPEKEREREKEKMDRVLVLVQDDLVAKCCRFQLKFDVENPCGELFQSTRLDFSFSLSLVLS